MNLYKLSMKEGYARDISDQHELDYVIEHIIVAADSKEKARRLCDEKWPMGMYAAKKLEGRFSDRTVLLFWDDEKKSHL